MYVRPPDRGRQTVKIPENYSGSAFRDISSTYPPPISPQKRAEPSLTDEFPPSPVPTPRDHFEILDNGFDRSDANLEPPHGTEKGEVEEEVSPASVEGPVSLPTKKLSGFLSGSLPLSERSFPFGHGIGSEELLILAMMLLVFLSEEDDRELLLYLGLLLFAG